MKKLNDEISEYSKQKHLINFHRRNQGEFLTKDQEECYQISQNNHEIQKTMETNIQNSGRKLFINPVL